MEELKNVPEISYKEFQKNGLMKVGLVITNVPPRSLYTTQHFVDSEKISNFLKTTYPIDFENLRGYWSMQLFGKPRLVLGDGNTRALIALQTGTHISITVMGQLPLGAQTIPLTKLYQTYVDLFQEF